MKTARPDRCDKRARWSVPFQPCDRVAKSFRAALITAMSGRKALEFGALGRAAVVRHFQDPNRDLANDDATDVPSLPILL